MEKVQQIKFFFDSKETKYWGILILAAAILLTLHRLYLKTILIPLKINLNLDKYTEYEYLR